MNKQELLDKLNWLMDAYSSDGGFSSDVRTGLAIAIAEIEKLDEPEKVVEKEKLYTVQLKNGSILIKDPEFNTFQLCKAPKEQIEGYEYKLTQSEIESVDPVLMQLAEEVE